eukprot:TRINITY_DN2132_c0_g1_i19.p1 TRINITY_DN2132_c0_g1~~TRINITY_DN2132_c0_g1_i19.p1  ORF type:complete len:169 (+),score=44.24 TRINITY_DN2132_c0_g1_i19:77-583(+)
MMFEEFESPVQIKQWYQRRVRGGMSGQAIDITTLPVEQLGMIIKQLEEEIQILQTSFSQLKSARSAYTDTVEALESVTPKHKGKQLFVPITSSLYVRGRLSQVDTVLVDIGTGYFVQKTGQEAKEYTHRKVKELDERSGQIQKALETKRQNLVQLQMVFQAKLLSKRQ